MSEENFPYPKGNWKDTFPLHLLAMETSFFHRNFSLHPNHSVYLAGIISRRLDLDYWKDVKDQFIIENPEEIQTLIRKHSPYIGQNAPIVTVTKYNAEHYFMQNAIDLDSYFSIFTLGLPTRYFQIASTYSYYSGKSFLGDIFKYFGYNLKKILSPLQFYLQDLKGRLEIPQPHPIIKEIWEKFGVNLDTNIQKKSNSQYYDSSVELDKLLIKYYN